MNNDQKKKYQECAANLVLARNINKSIPKGPEYTGKFKSKYEAKAKLIKETVDLIKTHLLPINYGYRIVNYKGTNDFIKYATFFDISARAVKSVNREYEHKDKNSKICIFSFHGKYCDKKYKGKKKDYKNNSVKRRRK